MINTVEFIILMLIYQNEDCVQLEQQDIAL